MTTEVSSPEHDFLQAQTRVFHGYGLDVASRFVEISGPGGSSVAHVLTTGHGPPVMMVIGGGLPAAMWAPLMAKLPGFSLYAIDMPGLGLSEPMRFRSRSFRAASVAVLTQTLDALDLDRASFVGQSIGGLWSTWVALDFPRRVASLSLVGCPAGILGTSAPLPLRTLAVPGVGNLISAFEDPCREQVEKVGKMAGEDLSRHPELADLLVSAERLPSWDRSLRRIVGSVVRLRGIRSQIELREDQLRAVATPTQLIWGDHDPFGPPTVGARAAEVIPNAELHLVGGGHAPWFDEPELVASHVGPFLTNAARNGDTSVDRG